MLELYNIQAGIPNNLDRNRPVVVIDIFRASTSITAALAAGAREIHVAGSRAEADSLKEKIGGDIVMAGERSGLKIKGYDLGNSPREMTPEIVAGHPMIFNSTNGTKLLRRFDKFKNVAVGSIVSLTATVDYLSRFGEDPILCCAGREGTFSAEDTLAAGLIISRFRNGNLKLDDAAEFACRLVDLSEGRWLEWARNSYHGRYLATIDLAEDLDYCLAIDKFDFVPIKKNNVIVRSGTI